ncbi:MAG: DNA-binding protein [Clostridia bacterium]|nr:DNA-binding protein [Clostridia bacterium]
MEKNVELTLIYEIYKELLTDNMRDVFEMYYYSDLSLREIGEEKQISYQAVNDTLKKAEKAIYEYENKLNLSKIKQNITKLNNKLNNENVDLNEVKQIAKELGEL